MNTAASRALERHRRARLTFATGMVARAVGLASLFISLRISLPWLGESRFGVLATLAGLGALLAFLDLGIGNGLVAEVARLEATQARVALKRLTSRGLALVGVLGIAVGAVLALATEAAPLERLFRGADASTLDEARSALRLFALFFGLSLPLGAAQRVMAGLQQGYKAHLATALCAMAGLALTLALPRLGGGVSSFLAAGYGMSVMAGAPLLVALARQGLLGWPGHGWLASTDTRRLLQAGGLYFVLQIGTLVGASIDTVLVSATLGPAAVATLVVVQRLFMLVTVPVQMRSLPLWSAYSHAMASGDAGFVRNTFRHSVRWNLAIALAGGALLVASAPWLAGFMTASLVAVPVALSLGQAAWTLLDAWGVAVSMRLNGARIIVPQVVTTLSFVALSIALKVVLLEPLGLACLPWLTATAFVLAVVMPYLTGFRQQVFAGA